MSIQASIITEDCITFFHKGTMHHVRRDNLNYDAIKTAILDRDFDVIEGLINPLAIIVKQTSGALRAEGNELYYKNDKLNDVLVRRLFEMIQGGHKNLSHYLKFIENTYANPSRASREQLYTFIDRKDMPITEDGCVLGYKGVSADYMDIHSGTWRNMPGDVNKMERRDVDDNPNHDCSHGFHIGTLRYANSWAGSDGKLLIVKYDPADAVSVPADGQFEKLRVWKYEVVQEVPTDQRGQNFLLGPVYTASGLSPSEFTIPHDEEPEHGDNWYKARNYIETARDNGETEINNRVLDDLFDISEWHESEWDSLVEETGIIPEQWVCRLVPATYEDLTT